MGGSDSGVQCSGTQEHCALLGFQQLMQDLDPCGRGQTCTSSSSTPVDSVALFVFPAVTLATAGKDYGSPSCGSPTVVPYTFSNVTPGTSQNLFLPSADTYQVYPVPSGTTTPTPFDSEYLTTDGGGLRSADPLVIASGANTCSGLGTPGGAQTYYAQVIYTAQAALVAQQKASPGSTNAIILLTDGNATACGGSTANTSAGACSSNPANIQAVSGTLNGTGTSSTNPTGYLSPTYPSVLGTCGQAVQAAKDVATSTTINNAGSFTKVITIGYGTLLSGCSSDKTYSNTVTNAGGNATWKAGDNPCNSIQAMADSSADFYSDDANGCKATDTTNASFTSLTQIFDKIAGQLSAPRLIPNGLT